MGGDSMGPREQYGELDNPTDTMPEMLMPWLWKLIYIHEEDERSRLWREQEFVLQGRQEFYTPRSDEWSIKNSEDMQT